MIKRVFLIAMSVTAVLIMTVPFFSFTFTSAQAAGKPAPTYTPYFGDLHTHTSYSDGWEGTPWDAYQAAINAGADYMAVTDHFDFWNAYTGLSLNATEWADTLAAADHFTSRKFVAMAGFEAWLLGHLGEINVYNARELPSHDQLGNKFDRLPFVYDWLSQQPGASGQFNHPYYMTNDFENFDYRTAARDSAMNLIEVWNAKFDEAAYVQALEAGWHVMPTANSDTHNPDWISGYEERTVLLAESLTPANLYAAMRACRGYATLDSNLHISYTLNGQVMGSTLAPTTTYTASIHIQDPDNSATDAITLVEIVSDGGTVVASMPTSGNTVDWTLTLSSGSAHYFYLRVSTESTIDGGPGVTAWSAPVWTGR